MFLKKRVTRGIVTTRSRLQGFRRHGIGTGGYHIRELMLVVVAAWTIAAVVWAFWISHGYQPATEEAIRHNNLGVALMDAGAKDRRYFTDAEKEFKAALRCAPNYRTALVNLGIAQFFVTNDNYERRVKDSESTMKRVVHYDPDNPHANFILGLITQYSSTEEATEYFSQVIKKDPQATEAYYRYGECCFRMGQYRKAYWAFRVAAMLASGNEGISYMLYQTLLKLGKSEEAEIELARFMKLPRNPHKAKAGRSFEYTSFGKYAEAFTDRTAYQQVPIPTRYKDVTTKTELRFKHAGALHDADIQQILRGFSESRDWFAKKINRERLISAFGSGASFCDYNYDGLMDIFLVNTNGDHRLYEQKPNGRFEDATKQAGLKNSPRLGMACVWGDYDNDRFPDLLITGYGDVRLYHNRNGLLTDVTKKTGIAKSVKDTTWCMGASFADVDHDGDLDIFICCFVDITSPLPRSGDKLRFPLDFPSQTSLLFRNNRNGTFTEIGRKAITDYKRSKTRDVLFTNLNDDDAIDFVRFDHAGRTEGFLNRGDGTFSGSASIPARRFSTEPIGRSHAFGDFDQDGAVDQLINQNGREAILLRNTARPANWLTVRLTGYVDPNAVKSNRMGIGSSVEVRSVGIWDVNELRAGNGALGCDAPELYFDLGNQKRLDYVRAFFPSGDRMTHTRVNARQALPIIEPILPCNSCPTLFSWNGRRFQFITDTIGAGILGELIAPDTFWPPDPDEWLRIPDGALEPKHSIVSGKSRATLDLRFVNSLEEVTYLDNVNLIAVDHPDSVAIYPNERMVNEPTNRERIQAFALKNLRPIANAYDHEGNEVTDRLAKVDRRYFDNFGSTPFRGFAKNWSLTIDLDSSRDFATSSENVVLLIHSWSFWNSSASIVAAAQANVALWGPALDVKGVDGRWRTGIEDMGVSAGLPRTIVVDLSNVLRSGEHFVRIRSNRMLYYDQIRVGEIVERFDLDEARKDSTRLHSIPLMSADLHWLGYPSRILPDGKLPEVFDYTHLQQRAEWGTHAGMLTRYGDVMSLLKKSDDEFVVMEHGEEVSLSFDSARLPPFPAGWKRTFLFHSDGYEKGYELHSLHSRTVDPLPFHGMKSYRDIRYTAHSETPRYQFISRWNTRPSFMRR